MREEMRKYAQEVREMRRLQRSYFSMRSQRVLAAAKIQEKKVDEMTNEILNAR